MRNARRGERHKIHVFELRRESLRSSVTMGHRCDHVPTRPFGRPLTNNDCMLCCAAISVSRTRSTWSPSSSMSRHARPATASTAGRRSYLYLTPFFVFTAIAMGIALRTSHEDHLDDCHPSTGFPLPIKWPHIQMMSGSSYDRPLAPPVSTPLETRRIFLEAVYLDVYIATLTSESGRLI